MWRLKVAEGAGDPWVRTTNNHVGRDVWEFDPNFGSQEDRKAVEEARANFTKHRFEKKHSSDLIMRMQFAKENPCDLSKLPRVSISEGEDPSVEAVTVTLQRALKFYSTLQAHDGHWPGDLGGGLFYVPPLVSFYASLFCYYVASAFWAFLVWKASIATNEDGGWGLHIEGHSTMFCTALNYVALRLFGERLEGKESGRLEKARKWILDRGGVTAIPSMGKMWLSVLGVIDWSGNNPIPPEAWLLPYFIPMHPGRMWCHTRLVHLPMSYLYGRRFVGRITITVLELRRELLLLPYEQVDWNGARNFCAKEDLNHSHPFIQDVISTTLQKIVEPILMHWPIYILREKALNTVMQHIHYEDENTQYICINVAHKVLNMLCCWVEDPNSEAFKLHLSRILDYGWIAEDGMKMKGINGSQSWDTPFAVQSIIATNLVEDCQIMLRKAHDFIKNSQLTLWFLTFQSVALFLVQKIQDNCLGDFRFWHRHISKGGWTFSTADCRWQVSDCTAEALKVSNFSINAALLLAKLPPTMVGEPLDVDKLNDANDGGGFGSYEPKRSYAWLEILNSSESLENVVIDYPYVECNSSVIQALTAFRKAYPGLLNEVIEDSISKAANFIKKEHAFDSVILSNGNLYSSNRYGNWGVCFTYGTWFGIEGLVAAGMSYEDCSAIRKACKFLLSKQLPSGGWGESYLSCRHQRKTENSVFSFGKKSYP
ncbi:Cycloartenol Synthase [Nymphaea thermarum]|nr:Cycloartenol Synthase [Nymphaea thermarum]